MVWQDQDYEVRRQAIFVPIDTANAKEGKGGGHQVPPAQWPGPGDGLLLPANIQGAINNRQAHLRCPTVGPTIRGGRVWQEQEYEACRQAIFVSRDTANAEEGRGVGHQAAPSTMARTRGWPTPAGKYARNPHQPAGTPEVPDRQANH
jgi:hypothetical protein